MGAFNGNNKLKIFGGSTKVKKAYLGEEKLYSSGNIVTYMVDSGAVYAEEVDEGASILAPATFVPVKSGWTFLGWRKDTVASSSVLSSEVMEDEPVTLYAVFTQGVALTYYDGSTTAKSKSGTRYYNNGNISNPGFTMTSRCMIHRSALCRSHWLYYRHCCSKPCLLQSVCCCRI